MEKPRQAGGLWSCSRPASYSQETQKMLKVMMEESKLTNFQRRQITKSLTDGAALPPSLGPSSSAPGPQQPEQKVMGTPQRDYVPSRRRSEQTCRSGDSYRRDAFRPRPTRDLEKEKSRLQSILATGKDETKPKPSRSEAQSPETMEKDGFQEAPSSVVVDEIEERRQFLADMTALGQEKLYRNLINTEIAQKIRELELMDKTRSAALRDMTS
ncbi:UPF0193 protein EVG1 isoform X1 [Gadus morhua]|uniref:UPF0193 protein EVG1 isoform X1 n=1 Tax=Gadus morhua TaxID=8049 RepID=UPI0011B5AB50|nr:UPF0193 protein EVG1 isoform X1 [Gadus morhua]XP_030206487.1 UPF0193 protein EVG1 isoform X1 [Gadus morhua]XP_030206488.1 UPF0193 protein EVG1 isoform X1 [Gadus morhua]